MNELKHYGVPGMKWGQRKAAPVSGGTSGRIPKSKSAVAGSIGKKTKASTAQKTKKQIEADEAVKAAKRAKVKKGLAIAGGVLAAIGTVAVATYAVKKYGNAMAKSGMEAQKTIDKSHRSNIAKRAAATKSYNREMRSVSSSLRAIGGTRVNDLAAGMTYAKAATNARLSSNAPVKIRNIKNFI